MPTQPSWKYWKDQISGYATMTKQYLDQGWRGNLMTFISNQLRGGERQVNHQMQYQIEGTYASFLTRLTACIWCNQSDPDRMSRLAGRKI
jgi:hypothetical protein